MRIRNKFTSYMLITAMVPLIVSMGIALWHSTNQTAKLTMEATQGRLDTAAHKLSRFFSTRVAEISTYSQTSLFKTMDFQQIRPFLMSELTRHNNIYEKFILGTPEGYFYNTAGGNPAVKGLRTKNDNDPNAKPKHIRKRDYWQNTVGNNTSSLQKYYISDPMISYTTGAKQIVVAATILSDKNKVNGMIGGALPWTDIQKRITQLGNEISQQLNLDTKLFLISNTGTYWYHWNPEKVVHLKLDKAGKPFINEIGEKKIIKSNIQDESTPGIATTGKKMMKGENGYSLYTDTKSNRENYIVYSHIPYANYSLGLVVPKEQILAEVNSLQSLFIYIFLVAAGITLLISLLVSNNISSPIISLNKMAKQLGSGNWDIKLQQNGENEIRELTQSFTTMTRSLESREKLLKKSEERLEKLNQELEQRITDRTNELNVINANLQSQINERIHTEKTLKNKEQLLKDAGELAHIGGWKLNLSDNELEWTEETYNLHKLEPGKKIDIDKAIQYFTPDSQVIYRKAIKNISKNDSPFDVELQLITENSEKIWVRVICQKQLAYNDSYELIGAYQDITELKKVEKLKNEFVSTVSHELRTPLTAIHGSISVLNSGHIINNDPDTTQEMLNVAERNSERLLSLINDLLDMEKIESGRMDFTYSVHPLNDLIIQSLIDNEPYGQKFNVSIHLCTDVPDVNLNVDRQRFFQVMSNLISNAAKFTQKDGSVEISTSIINNNILISVQDFGEGVPDNFKDKIFSKFSQADSSDTRNPGGTGLGLSITKSIVEHMGGTINYESKTGEGSRFYFTLPIAE